MLRSWMTGRRSTYFRPRMLPANISGRCTASWWASPAPKIGTPAPAARQPCQAPKGCGHYLGKTMTEVHHRAIPGVVLMIDLDKYLDRVGHMTPNAEWSFVAPIYRSAEALASKHHLHVIRIFGDGFLLYGKGHPEQKLLQNTIRFLVELQTALAEKDFRFKAAI